MCLMVVCLSSWATQRLYDTCQTMNWDADAAEKYTKKKLVFNIYSFQKYNNTYYYRGKKNVTRQTSRRFARLTSLPLSLHFSRHNLQANQHVMSGANGNFASGRS